MSSDELLRAASAAREHAHVPYSRFPVGAALRASDGRVFAGCNVENAAYPQGQCAEATAIGAMVAAGAKRIVEVAVVGGGESLCSPCGGCRQRLAEFATADVPVHLAGPEGIRLTVTMGELLPLSFGPGNLGSLPIAPGGNAAGRIREHAGPDLPRIAILLGSGLGTVAGGLTEAQAIDYRELPGFPRPSVEGHAGRLVMGRLGGVPVVCLAGRSHFYEGVGPGPLNTMVRTLKEIGCRVLLLTNAAGSLRPETGPGSLVLIDDHINLQGTSPLVGSNDPRIGPRFVDLSEVYAARLRSVLAAAAEREGMALARGVYLATLGPAFETPAEIRAFRTLGADLVGMSTVAEAISARHAGLEVAGLSVVTNLAAGLAAEPLTHVETLARSAEAAADVGRLLAAALPEIARGLD